ncbi:hypothetical protein DRE_02890 [Drechslerella stenobrocha 248]|uniref:Uncharacterized protein n=1 Tax=Drechslerella stenobrocha 248 TaxID=1043628 RepID=W7IF45_9PEZI|nr:hypothetical protein DRE_02890 [Drechslerella stenobrocha 248]
MKISTILVATAAVTGVQALWEGKNPTDILNKIRAAKDYARWPIVVSCDRSTVSGTGWERTPARIARGAFNSVNCDITWCNPDNGRCKFELLGDGGDRNWQQANWWRDGKKLCYPKPCNQM